MIKINLAPPIEKRRIRVGMPGFNLGLLFTVLVVLLAGAVGLWWWGLDAEVQELHRQIADNEQEIGRLKTVIAEGQRFKKETEELESRVNAIETVARLQTRPVYLLDAVADMPTRDLWLTRMEEKGDVLRFVGTTYSAVALSDFMNNLRASEKFKEVDLVISSQDLTKSPRTITFEVTCRYEI